MHTKDILAAELRKAGLDILADKAANGDYHDFLSELEAPALQLERDLTTYANSPSWPRKAEAQALLYRHMNSEFESSREEAREWATLADDWVGIITQARAFRGTLSFSKRVIFDAEIRPILDGGNRIAYPDAIYHITPLDLLRAMEGVQDA